MGDASGGGICTDGDCEPDYWPTGCDLAAPQISIGDSAGGASLPAQWFTSENQLTRYLQSTVKCTDDCIDQPSCNIGVDYQDDQGKDRCGNTLVTVTSSDWCVRTRKCVVCSTTHTTRISTIDDAHAYR